MARGRRITISKTRITLYASHKASCPQKTDNSGTVDCKCIRWIQYTDGRRETTHQWTWPKAEQEARRIVTERDGQPLAPEKYGAYPVERAIDEWLAEREKDGIHNTKAKFIGAKLLAWCQRNGIEYLTQIEKQALRVWRTEGWKYRSGDSTSLKVHWCMLRSFFAWCVEGDLLAANPCPKWKGRIRQREVVPLTTQQMDALEAATDKLRSPGWTDERRLKMRALVLLMRWSGMAIHDSVCLERTQLIGQIIQRKRQKTKKQFSVSIPRWLADLLLALPQTHARCFFWHKRSDGTELRPDTFVTNFGGWFGELFKAVGIQGHSHQFRHSFATYHLSRGVPVERVAEWMGDSVAEVLRTYGHWVPARQEQSEQAMRDSWAKMGLDAAGNPINKSAVQ